MKKILSLFICFFVLAVALHAQSTTFRFSMSRDGTGLCIDKYTGDSQYVVINAYYDGLAVKEIGPGAFENNSNIISVLIPDTVEAIGYNAFSDCYNLVEITLPLNLEEIWEYAFRKCKSLSKVNVKTQTSIKWKDSYGYLGGTNAFYGCSSLPMDIQIKLIKLGYKDSF